MRHTLRVRPAVPAKASEKSGAPQAWLPGFWLVSPCVMMELLLLAKTPTPSRSEFASVLTGNATPGVLPPVKRALTAWMRLKPPPLSRG
jgi:hypothetical protein